ncbi:hypothetical protein [Aureimonas leprariae]|uniref:Tir chaperone protein (CesT) family protein n=1 Tax=Plantimonas leprariae TaxID=2615207 RepID=A0A7V7PPC7_9HYPH|nr:hypothetical protein [Aureimonas leprariae]KAB0679841.1 hypothetical protein F6X38_11485 [Aureimonas leprariae]
MGIDNASFARALAELDADISATSPRSADFLFEDDLPVRVTLHPDEQTILVDAFAFDESELAPEAGAAMSRTLLQLNGLALVGEPFAIGLTPASIVAVTVRASLARAGTGGLAEPIAYAVAQAREIRSLLETIEATDGGGLAAFNL